MKIRRFGTWLALMVLVGTCPLLAGDARASMARAESRADDDLAPCAEDFEGPFELDVDGSSTPDEGELGQVSPLALGQAAVKLAPGRHEEWIDRLVLPQWGRNLYYLLIEGCDADGDADVLIDDSSFAPAPRTSKLRDYVPGRVVTYGDRTYLVVAEVATDTDSASLGNVVFPVVGCFEYDHPEVFWLNRTICYATVGFPTSPNPTRFLLLGLTDAGGGYDIREDSYRSGDAIVRDVAYRDRRVSQLVAEARRRGATSYGQVRHFNRWLTESNDYNIAVSRGGKAPSDLVYRSITALKGRTGPAGPVCDGYAKAFKVLCDAAGIPCVFVRGLTDPGDPASRHGWNEVRIDGVWYAVDVTWDDPTGPSIQTAKSGRETEEHLLVGSKTLDANGRTFASRHVETADFFGPGSIQLLNGPSLSASTYWAPGHEPVAVYRLLNPYTGEHLFTTSVDEYRELPALGWRQEGIAWYGVRSAGVPVYRLANPYTGGHLYTSSFAEYDELGRLGWRREGVAWLSEDARRIPVYRLFNRHDPGPGAHLLTADAVERDALRRLGWSYEGLACNATPM